MAKEDRMVGDLEYRALLAADIEHSAGRGDPALRRIRDVLFTELRASVEYSGIDWDGCVRRDLGDGMVLTAPRGTPLTSLIQPLTAQLSQRLRAHNRESSELTRVRARVVVHAGHVRVEDDTVTGQPLEVLARLLDAPNAKKALLDAPQSVSVALLVSQHVHDEAVQHGYLGIDPDDFHRIPITVKEYSGYGWLHLPGAGAISLGTAPVEPDEVRSKMVNKASGHGTIIANQGGDQNFRITKRS